MPRGWREGLQSAFPDSELTSRSTSITCSTCCRVMSWNWIDTISFLNASDHCCPVYSLVGNIGDTWGLKKSSDQAWHLLDCSQLRLDLLAQLFAFAQWRSGDTGSLYMAPDQFIRIQFRRIDR